MSKPVRVKSYIRNADRAAVKQQGQPEVMALMLVASMVLITCNWISQLLK